MAIEFNCSGCHFGGGGGIGPLVLAQASYMRNSGSEGEWNYRIDPDLTGNLQQVSLSYRLGVRGDRNRGLVGLHRGFRHLDIHVMHAISPFPTRELRPTPEGALRYWTSFASGKMG
jgi:hypothetical protein